MLKKYFEAWEVLFINWAFTKHAVQIELISNLTIIAHLILQKRIVLLHESSSQPQYEMIFKTCLKHSNS